MPRRVGALVVGALLVAGCVFYGPSDPAPADPDLLTQEQPNPLWQFQAAPSCGYVGSAQVDPIVSPGGVSAHLHDFFITQPSAHDTTWGQLQLLPSSCPTDANHTAVWTPTAYDADGNQMTPEGVLIYYRSHGHEGTVLPWAPGFRMITDRAVDLEGTPPSFGGEPRDRMALFVFGSCWNGQPDAEDHRSHVEFVPPAADCPATHPVAVPRVTMFVTYPAHPESWSSGDWSTAHADYMNGWDEETLAVLVDACLNVGMFASSENFDGCKTGQVLPGMSYDEGQ